MGRVTLHIGAGKCGSTAIQDALTRHPVIPLAQGGEATYVVIGQRGDVAAGRQVTPKSNGKSRRSAQHAPLLDLAPGPFDDIRRALSDIANPVLSSESYLSGSIPGRAFLGRLGLPVHAVVYVRPQVDYVNSAFWQWDAWDGKTVREWLRHRIKRSQWHDKVSHWVAIPEVELVTVRLLPGDVVADFLGVLGTSPDFAPPEARPNQSLPGAVLRFLQRHPRLRKKYHDELTWVLPKLLKGRDLGPVPWLITPEMAQRIVHDSRKDNERLLGMLDPESAERMRADRRWWDADAYAGREAEPVIGSGSDDPRLDVLTLSLFEALMRLAAPKPPKPKATRPAGEEATRPSSGQASALGPVAAEAGPTAA